MDEPARLAWFEAMLQGNHAQLVAFLRGLLGDEQQARDAAQDVFVAAWRAACERKPPFAEAHEDAGVHRWLFAVAYHRAISLLRHRRAIAWESLDQLAEADANTFCAPTPIEDRVAENEALRAALASLAPQDAACVLLSVVHSFAIWEIAHIVGISPDAAKKRLWRAKERLRAAYFAQNELPREQTHK